MSASYRIDISKDLKSAEILRKDDDTGKITLFDCKLGDPIQIQNPEEFRKTHGKQLEKGIYAVFQDTGKSTGNHYPTYWLPIVERVQRIFDKPFEKRYSIVYID